MMGASSRAYGQEGRPMTEKLVVFCNYAVSADGKISTADRRGSGFASRGDRHRMDRIRARADLIVVGAETVRHDDPPFTLRSAEIVRRRLDEGRRPHPDVCILTRSGRLPAGLKLGRQDRQRILVATAAAMFALPNGWKARTEMIRLADPPDMANLVTELAARGYRQVLVEGGGTVNSLFFEAGLVDEVYLTLCPVILGGATAPTPVEGRGFPFAERLGLELLEWEHVDGELFLHYRTRRP
jgi:5-amino-6-(5-phosphoribosylamino)uracil reductase